MRFVAVGLIACILLAGCSATETTLDPACGADCDEMAEPPIYDGTPASCSSGVDEDGDGIDDGCDDDPRDGPRGDADLDGIPNEDDRCPGQPDDRDADGLLDCEVVTMVVNEATCLAMQQYRDAPDRVRVRAVLGGSPTTPQSACGFFPPRSMTPWVYVRAEPQSCAVMEHDGPARYRIGLDAQQLGPLCLDKQNVDWSPWIGVKV